MYKKILLISAILSTGVFQAANADPLDLTFSPDTQNTTVGGDVSVDLVLSGLTNGEILSAFDVVVDYNSSILSFTGGTYGNFNGDQQFPNTISTIGPTIFSGPSGVELTLTSGSSDAGLAASQGSSVILGTLDFTGLSAGVSPLSYAYVDLTGGGNGTISYDTDPANPGNTLANGTVNTGSICVANCSNPPPPSLPEPASLWLIALGAFGLVGSRKRKAKLGGV